MSEIFTLLLVQLCIFYFSSTAALFTVITTSFGTGFKIFIHPMRSAILLAIVQNISKPSNAAVDILIPELAAPQKSSHPKHRTRRIKKDCGVVPGISEIPIVGPGCSVM